MTPTPTAAELAASRAASMNKPPIPAVQTEIKDEATPEIFFNRVPGSSFAGGKVNTIFIPDRYNPSVGRYETSDAQEIAELKAAIRTGAPTIFQDPTAIPYAKSANPIERAQQEANVKAAQADIEARRKAAQDALEKQRIEAAANPSGVALSGIQNSGDIQGNAANR